MYYPVVDGLSRTQETHLVYNGIAVKIKMSLFQKKNISEVTMCRQRDQQDPHHLGFGKIEVIHTLRLLYLSPGLDTESWGTTVN